MLKIGTKRNGTPLALPMDAQVQTFAILAIRGAGKTCAATVIAEEMLKADLPWICLDPVGVWWGLRTSPDGEGRGLPVVIFGGQHADLPLAAGGKKIADALLSEPICAVLDVSQESKRFWHTFLTDFCLRLMELNPDAPRHIFIEEAPEFVPQRTRVDLTARCKEAVERLIRLGRNRGYGCTLISQRPATVDKDVLSQCENLFVMRTVGPHDRKALMEWIVNKNVAATEEMLAELSQLPNGSAYFWSPHWMRTFTRVMFRRRETYHPGETRQIGKAAMAVRLSDVGKFVDRLRPTLAVKEQVRRIIDREPPNAFGSIQDAVDNPMLERINILESQLGEALAKWRDVDRRLAKVREMLRPQYETLSVLFSEVVQNGGDIIDQSIYGPWLQKAGQRGCRRMLEILIQRRQLTKNQLGTLAGVASTKSTFRAYMAWLRANGLIETDGETVRLKQ